MSAFEIVLLILGIIIFIISFLVSGKKGEGADGSGYALTEEEMDKLVGEKLKDAEQKLSSSVDDSVEYSLTKAERSMEKLTNEKIMALSEYADTVMSDIHKNHEEVVFLYDMLSDKQTNLKNIAREVEATAKSAKETVNDAKVDAAEIADSAPAAPETPAFTPFVIQEAVPSEKKEEKKRTVKKDANTAARKDPQGRQEEIPSMMSQDFDAGLEDGGNQNAQILALHKAGKSNMAIAKQLGMGVGEVKLVIDLFKEL